MEYQVKASNPHRIFRAAILKGVTPPEYVEAQLRTMGVDVGELETRLRQQVEFKH